MVDDKQIIRNNISAIKKTLSKEKIADMSDKICNHLIQTSFFRKANCIALYNAMNDEVQTSELIENFYTKKNIALPVVKGNNMNFHLYTGANNISTGTFGITEPNNTKQIPLEEIDLIIVPGVAFDHNKNRIGRGRGYYDRLLSENNKPVIGICFDFQLLEYVPTERHDIKMDMVITESTVI